MSDLTNGRDLWRSRHPQPDTETDDDSQQTGAVTGIARGEQLWERRKAGGAFALGPEPVAPDVTPGGEAA